MNCIVSATAPVILKLFIQIGCRLHPFLTFFVITKLVELGSVYVKSTSLQVSPSVAD